VVFGLGGAVWSEADESANSDSIPPGIAGESFFGRRMATALQLSVLSNDRFGNEDNDNAEKCYKIKVDYQSASC
jgi:hypothetical protein